MLSSISPDQVRAEVQKFWQIMCGKAPGKLEDLYSPSALVLTGKARQPEAVNVALARRTRQIGAPGSNAAAELGVVEVQVADPEVAIASYTYKFHQTRSGESGTLQKRHTLFGRATQIFQLDKGGTLRIVHEHLSAATNPEVEKAGTSSA